MSTKTYTFMVGDKEVTVTLTLEDGKVTAKIDSDVDMDVNALFWSDGDDVAAFDGYKKKDSSLNMNGEGSRYEDEDGVEKVNWDGSDKISSPGSKDEGYILAGESKTFDLSMTPEEFEELVYFGIRATSVGEDGEDSLKLVGKPEGVEDEPPGDFFPEIEQGISYIMLVFDKPFGDDDYYTVKIDSWPGGEDEILDLNENFDDILAWVIECDPNVDKDTPLLGVKIKSGNNVDTLFYAVEGNENGTEPDDFPEDWGVEPGANPNAAWKGDIDAEYKFADVYNEDCDCVC